MSQVRIFATYRDETGADLTGVTFVFDAPEAAQKFGDVADGLEGLQTRWYNPPEGESSPWEVEVSVEDWKG